MEAESLGKRVGVRLVHRLSQGSTLHKQWVTTQTGRRPGWVGLGLLWGVLGEREGWGQAASARRQCAGGRGGGPRPRPRAQHQAKDSALDTGRSVS